MFSLFSCFCLYVSFKFFGKEFHIFFTKTWSIFLESHFLFDFSTAWFSYIFSSAYYFILLFTIYPTHITTHIFCFPFLFFLLYMYLKHILFISSSIRLFQKRWEKDERNLFGGLIESFRCSACNMQVFHRKKMNKKKKCELGKCKFSTHRERKWNVRFRFFFFFLYF